MSIRIENIFEELCVSEGCFQEIIEKVNKEIEFEIANRVLPIRREKVEALKRAIRVASSSEERNKSIKDLGVAQKRVMRAEDKAKEIPKKIQGITYTSKVLS